MGQGWEMTSSSVPQLRAWGGGALVMGAGAQCAYLKPGAASRAGLGLNCA